jgi:hypothetical protein
MIWKPLRRLKINRRIRRNTCRTVSINSSKVLEKVIDLNLFIAKNFQKTEKDAKWEEKARAMFNTEIFASKMRGSYPTKKLTPITSNATTISGRTRVQLRLENLSLDCGSKNPVF